MIKLTREQDEYLKQFDLEDDFVKEKALYIVSRVGWGGYLQNKNNVELKEHESNKIIDLRSEHDSEDKFKLTQAILDGKWEVEEQLYYVKLVDKGFGYLNQNIDDLRLIVSNKNQTWEWETKFTRAEVEAIDPRYLEFLEEVE